MSHKSAPPTVSTIGIDLGKNSFHLIGLDERGAIVWQLKCSRAQLERHHSKPAPRLDPTRLHFGTELPIRGCPLSR